MSETQSILLSKIQISPTAMEVESNFQKLMISARYWLLGMAEHDVAYFSVIKAMEFAASLHTGHRNGGQPEFIHQLGIFHHLRTLHRHIKNPVMVYTLAFLHDTVEDKNVSLARISEIWGASTAEKLDLLSKQVHGVKKLDYSLDPVFKDEDASIVKAADRVNNVSSMVGVFKKPRLERYVTETRNDFFPLMKKSRRLFPYQESVYENMKLELTNQLALIEAILPNYTLS